eukprot:scaffold82068_cov75-Phaeocystis_antarctica.AAC.3
MLTCVLGGARGAPELGADSGAPHGVGAGGARGRRRLDVARHRHARAARRAAEADAAADESWAAAEPMRPPPLLLAEAGRSSMGSSRLWSARNPPPVDTHAPTVARQPLHRVLGAYHLVHAASLHVHAQHRIEGVLERPRPVPTKLAERRRVTNCPKELLSRPPLRVDEERLRIRAAAVAVVATRPAVAVHVRLAEERRRVQPWASPEHVAAQRGAAEEDMR